MPTSCSKQEGQTRLLKALSKPSWGWLPHPRMDSHSFRVICSMPDCLQGENCRALNLSSFSFCPENLSYPRGRAVKSLAPCVWQPPHGPCLGAAVITPQILPFSRLNQPSPSARTCSCICHLCLSTALTPVRQNLCGAAKICHTSQTHNIISVSIFPTVEQLMRWQSETFKRQIWSQVEYHRSWFLV